LIDGILFVVSAPSGAGKTTILKKVMADLPGLIFSVSYTTRTPRQGERDGRDYHFINRELFAQIRSRRPTGFLEWAEVHGNFYGTGREEVDRLLGTGRDVVLDIDVQGAMQMRKTSDPVLIFIAPPSLAELESRLRKRGTETEAAIALRLENARREMRYANDYDYLIINDQLVEAVDCLRSIVVAERCRRRRSPAGSPLRMAL
jgi:guanylate kinase